MRQTIRVPRTFETKEGEEKTTWDTIGHLHTREKDGKRQNFITFSGVLSHIFGGTAAMVFEEKKTDKKKNNEEKDAINNG